LWVYYAEGSADNQFGKIQEEHPHEEADLSPLPLYESDSGETDVFDFGGVVRTITLVITKTTDSSSAMASFLTALFGLIPGAQDPEHGYPFTYTSTLLGAIKVKVAEIDVLTLSPTELLCEYTIKLIESSEVG